MHSVQKNARLAGLAYLILILSGIFSLMYVPSMLIVRADAATTFNNIVAGETLFRLGIVSGIVCYIAFIILPLLLYKLLSPVNKTSALLMVIFSLISIPLSFANLLNHTSILTLISGAEFLKVYDAPQLQSQVMLYLKLYSNGESIASIFWGLWLFPFGYLVYHSGFLPKVFGIFLITGCFSYLIEFFARFLLPDYYSDWLSTIVTAPASIGELGICLWLLVRGINIKKWEQRSF